MTLLRREPRSVYRVYAEDEYLDGEHAPLDPAAQEAPPQPGRLSPSALLLTTAIVVVALAVLAIVLLAGRGSPRRAPAAAAPAPAERRQPDAYRPPPSVPQRIRVRARVYVRPRPARRWPVALRPQTVIAAPSTPPPVPQLEFGFER